MADYAPAYLAGNTVPMTASGTITGGDPLEVSGAGTVAKCVTATTPKYVGVAAHDAQAGQRITVIAARVIHDGIAEGTITAGDQLTASTVAGKTVKSLAASAQDVTGTPTQSTINTAINNAVNQARSVIGVALTSAADGASVRWQQG